MKNNVNFKVISGNWGNGEYKYNVQRLCNGVYSGQGRFARDYKEVLAYITKELKGEQ